MNLYCVSYDLSHADGKDYTHLIAALKRFPTWCKPLESTWYVAYSGSAEQVVKYLTPYMHSKDKLLVTAVARTGAWWSKGMTAIVLNWLRGQIKAQGAVAK